MTLQRLERIGNKFVVAVPDDEVERLHLQEGQLVDVELHPLEVEPRLRPELRAFLDEEFPKSEEALRYLAQH